MLTAIAGAQAIKGEFLVHCRPGFRPTTSETSLVSARRNLFLVRTADPMMEARLAFNPGVESVEPNYRTRLFQVNDTNFGAEWHLPKIHATNAWSFTHGLASVKVAILDTGVDLGHYDLAGKILARTSFVGDQGQDSIGHGTHVAGIIGGVTNNNRGIAAVGYDTSVIVAKVVDNFGNGSDALAIKGIEWAVAQGAKVISMSFGQQEYSQALKDAVDDAWNSGVVVVAAAGNYGTTTKVYPAAYENCIAVAATDKQDKKSPFSSYGSWVTIAAPGSSILSTFPGNSTKFLSGTSFSAPMVAAAAALLWANGARSNYSIRQALRTSGEPTSGFGMFPILRLDVRRALLRFP